MWMDVLCSGLDYSRDQCSLATALLYKQQTRHYSSCSVCSIYAFKSDASSRSNDLSAKWKSSINVYCILYFVSNMYCVLSAQHMLHTHNMQRHIGFRDEDSGEDVPWHHWGKLCRFSAFLNLTHSTWLDCTLPVTPTYFLYAHDSLLHFSWLGKNIYLISTDRFKVEFLFYNFVPKAGFFIYTFFLIWKI